MLRILFDDLIMGIKLHIIKGIKLAKWKTIPGIASGVNSKKR